MIQFSANLGFLWQDRPLPDAIHAAHAAGFDAVECHWPYDTDPGAVARALQETGLPMLGLNTTRGDVAGGENGLSALPGREAEARDAIREALAYAQATGTGNVHVMAGFAEGPEAFRTFVDNLGFAVTEAAAHDIGLLIEPLNIHDAPGYFHATAEAAQTVLRAVNAPGLMLMFDCYHMGRMGADVTALMAEVWDDIGHIQFAAVPDRGPPDHGTLRYSDVFAKAVALGWAAPFGAEYKPVGATDDSLAWMADLRQSG